MEGGLVGLWGLGPPRLSSRSRRLCVRGNGGRAGDHACCGDSPLGRQRWGGGEKGALAGARGLLCGQSGGGEGSLIGLVWGPSCPRAGCLDGIDPYFVRGFYIVSVRHMGRKGRLNLRKEGKGLW